MTLRHAPVVALALVAAFAAAGCASARPRKDPALAHGRVAAERACGACHGIARGEKSRMRGAPAFDSTDMRHMAGLDGRIAEIARAGHYDMPPIRLTPDEARDIARYIDSLQPR